MVDRLIFNSLLEKYARVQGIADKDVLFGGGIDISSIGFTEFIMELEEVCNVDIDLDMLDETVKTVGQLYDRIESIT